MFFSSSIRMNGKNIIFDEKKINKSSFYKNKKLFIIDDVYVNKILTSIKEAYGLKARLNTLLDIIIKKKLDH